MIAFYRLWDKMNRAGIRKKDLKDQDILSPATINKLVNNEVVTTGTLNKLCTYFNCQLEEICEFIPDSEDTEE